MDIADLLMMAPDAGASDIHLTVGCPPAMRINGSIVRVEGAEPLTRDKLRSMLYEILTDQQKARFEENKELDFAVELAGVGRFRVNAFVGRTGEGAAFRAIPNAIRTFEELGLPPICAELARSEKGLLLVTGPTGSGKSTTLATMIDLINRERQCHILTIEDPIEFIHEHQSSIVNQREVGPHTHSFSNALRSALREDPDVILIGEMRDLETISLAITAAETGHFVLGTLHTMGAPQTVDRIIDVFPADQQEQVRAQLADSIRGVISQTLLKRADGRGRVAGLEIMVANSAIRNLIREAKTFQIHSVMETATKEGMRTMDQHLKELVQAGIVTREEAAMRLFDPHALDGLAPSAGRGPAFGVQNTNPFVQPANPPGAPQWGKRINY